MTRQEAIERWTNVARAVFTAEERISKEWHERLKAATSLPSEQQVAVADEYCEAVAKEIVNNTSEEQLAEM